MADVFDGAKDVKPNQVSFAKVGDLIAGYFTGHKDVIGKNGPIKLYEVKGLFGSYHGQEITADANGNKIVKVIEPPVEVVQGEYYTIFGGKDSIDGLFKKAKYGQKVGLRFESATPSKTKGNSPFKVFKTVMWDEIDPDMGASSEETVSVE
jgi:hypothetical protein